MTVEPADAAAETLWAARLSPSRLDEGAPTPLYHQVHRLLRELIRGGEAAAGSALPGEPALARLLGVSRITVKRALNELAAEGWVSRRQGLGTFVTPRAAAPVVRSSFDELLASLQQMGLMTAIELLEVGAVTAGEAGVAAQMELAPEAPLQRAVRRRRLEGEPLSHLVSYTPAAIAARYDAEALASTPFLTLLDRAGAAPAEAEQWITAAAAEPPVASALGVEAGAPLLRIERLMRDASGRVVQLVHGFYRPDRFQYHVRNARLPAAGARRADDS